jgi:hypothetical protein
VAIVVAVVVILVLVGVGLRGEKVASNLNIGEPAKIDGLRVVADRVEVSETDDRRCIWTHVTAQNVGDKATNDPVLIQFEYRGQEVGISSSQGCVDRGRLGFPPFADLFPGQTADGWQVIDVPTTVSLPDLRVVFNLGLIGGKIATWRLGQAGATVEP